MNLRQFGEMLKEAAQEWGADKAPRMGAALAYYTMFSLAPLLLIVVGVASLVLGERTSRGEILGQIESTVGARPPLPSRRSSRTREAGPLAGTRVAHHGRR